MKVRRIGFEAGLLFIATALLPIYVFKSGGVQPTHAVFFLLAIVTLGRRGIPITPWSIFLFVLFAYSLLIETTYALSSGTPKFIINSIFFLFNFVLVCAIYQNVKEKGLSTLTPGLIVAASIGLFAILINGINFQNLEGTGRSTGTFNNPNQLGYFSVCVLSFSYLLYRSGSIRYWVAVSLFAVSIFLAVASLSKAAMISNAIVIFIALKPGASRNSILLWLIGCATGLSLIYQLHQNGAFDSYIFAERLTNIRNENDSSLASRGYFAFLEGNGLQLIFGLGAHGVDNIVGHEVHSTFASVLNNYGLVGFSLFFLVYFLWSVRIWRFYGFAGFICLVCPSTLYGITHNGIRFTIFWLFFSATLGIIQNSRTKKGEVSHISETGIEPHTKFKQEFT